MEQNLKDGLETSNVSFAKFDSTMHVSDSAIVALRRTTDKTIYKGNIRYTETGRKQRPFYYKRVTYSINGKQFTNTFYVNHGLNGVVAFK